MLLDPVHITEYLLCTRKYSRRQAYDYNKMGAWFGMYHQEWQIPTQVASRDERSQLGGKCGHGGPSSVLGFRQSSMGQWRLRSRVTSLGCEARGDMAVLLEPGSWQKLRQGG